MIEGLTVRKCTTSQEKEVAKQFRQRHFFDIRGFLDPYLWTFERADHAHFALYKTGCVIGYAHIQYWPSSRAALRIIIIDEKERKRGYGAYLLKACEQTLKEEGVGLLQTEAAPDAVAFYRNLGYIEMPFNDPDHQPTHENDTPLGKLL